MSATQIKNEFNRMTELAANIQNTFVLVLVYTVIIATMMSALLGGVVMQAYYGIEFIFNLIPGVYNALSKFYEASFDYDNTYKNNDDNNNNKKTIKKPLIDESWCNVSVKNIINYEEEEDDEVEVEDEDEEEDEDEVEDEEDEVEDDEVEDEILSHKEISELEEEILSLRSIASSNEEEVVEATN
jgi:hypothetical protein